MGKVREICQSEKVGTMYLTEMASFHDSRIGACGSEVLRTLECFV